MRVTTLTYLVCACLMGTAVATCTPSVGFAQSASAEDRAAQLAREGLDLFNQGRFQDAFRAFSSANEAAASPVFGLYMARSLRNLGRLVEARAMFERVHQTPLGKAAPEPFVKAQTDAKREASALSDRIPLATFSVQPNKEGVDLRVKGRSYTALKEHPFDPGEHTVVAIVDGREVGRRTFTLVDDGRTAEVEVDIKPGAEGTTTGETPGSLVPGAIVLSVGAATLVAAAVTGGLAISKTDELIPLCPNGACPADKADELDSANALALTSTITLIAGGALSALGVTLLIIQPGGSTASTALELRGRGAGLDLLGRF